MTRYVMRLVAIAVFIAAVAGWGWWRGWSGTAITLAAILATALTWGPTLLALEGMSRVRRFGPDRVHRG